MRRDLAVAAAILAACAASAGPLAAGAGASAAPTAATQPAGHHTKATKAKPKPAGATARIYLYDAFQVGHKTVDVPGRTLRISGYVSHYVPDQKLTVIARLGHKVIATRKVKLVKSAKGAAGQFVISLHPGRAGILHLHVVHSRSPKLQGFSTGRGVDILPESSSSRLYTLLVQRALRARHIFLPEEAGWGLPTELAITAYHRLIGRGSSDVLDHATMIDLLDGRGTFAVRYPHNGRHAEGNLSDQLLALVDGSKVQAIYPMSSGKPSTPTILGNYQVYRRTPGYLPDGMYFSDFFIGGYAIHGYDPAPDYPASHGCMRLPISDAIPAFDWLALGDWVDVYGTPSGSV